MTITDLLPQFAPVQPSAPGGMAVSNGHQSDLAKIPAKTAVYLLLDSQDHPLLLATVGNLRAALQRRLTEIPADQKSKRIPYSQITHKILYRIVHSPFAANWFYYQAARLLFPQTYRDLISWQPACFLSINPAETFPRFRRTDDLSDPTLTYLGPISERRATDQLIQTLEDLFDLCRYYQILQQSPHGKPCAYKEMGKCPAPCDGTVTLDHYHAQINSALAYLSNSGYETWRASQEDLMRAAATKLNFELAAKLKVKLNRGTLLEQPQFVHIQNLKNFSYLSLQPGPGKPYIEPFFIHGGKIESAPPVKKKEIPVAAEEWLKKCQALAAIPVTPPFDQVSTEQLALIARHLFRGNDDPGLYLPLHTITNVDEIKKSADEFFSRRTPPKPMPEQSSEREAASAVAVEEPAAAEAKEGKNPE